MRPRAVAVILLALFVGSCGGGVDESELPSLVTPDLSDALPSIKEQIGTAAAAVEKRPASAEANGHLGMTLHTYHFWQSANAAYHRARLLEPDNGRWLYLNGVVLEELGEMNLATTLYESAVRISPNAYSPKIALAKALANNGDIERAIDVASALIDSDGPRPESFFELGRILHVAGQSDQAESYLLRSIELGNGFGAAHYTLAGVYRALGRADEAQAQYNLYARQKKVQLSLDDKWMADVQGLNNGWIQRQARARALYGRGQVDEALAILEDIIAEDPSNEIVAGTLVGLYGELERFDLADQRYAATMALDPQLPELHYNLGNARVKEGRLVEAIQAFEKAISIDPSNPEYYAKIGSVYAQRKQLKKAAVQYRRALEVLPGYAPAHRKLANLYFADGRLSDAQEHYAWLGASPRHRNPETLLRLAACYESSDLVEDALAALADAQKIVDAQKYRSVAATIEREIDRLSTVVLEGESP